MGLKDFSKMLHELYIINVLKRNGYSIFDVAGKDGVVNTYFKKVGAEKKIDIGNKTYIINERKKMIKWGMPYYRFNLSAFGEDKYGNTTVKNIDADTLNELIKKVRLTGQNTSKDEKNKFIYIILGGAIGFLASWVISGIFGA